jgi:hypothetical protein
MRIKITGTGGSITNVTGTDGTTTVTVMGTAVTGAAGGDTDVVFDFMTELNCTSFTATTAGGTATDVEVLYSV